MLFLLRIRNALKVLLLALLFFAVLPSCRLFREVDPGPGGIGRSRVGPLRTDRSADPSLLSRTFPDNRVVPCSKQGECFQVLEGDRLLLRWENFPGATHSVKRVTIFTPAYRPVRGPGVGDRADSLGGWRTGSAECRFFDSCKELSGGRHSCIRCGTEKIPYLTYVLRVEGGIEGLNLPAGASNNSLGNPVPLKKLKGRRIDALIWWPSAVRTPPG